MRLQTRSLWFALLPLAWAYGGAAQAAANPSNPAATPSTESTQAFDQSARAAVSQLESKVPGANQYVQKAAGVLVCPDVVKIGLVIGGQHGNCELRAGGKTSYYNLSGLSAGLTAGVQSAAIVITFEDQKALEQFRSSKGWQAGINGNIAVFKGGAGAAATTRGAGADVVAFVFGQQGLMADVSLSGSKFTPIQQSNAG